MTPGPPWPGLAGWELLEEMEDDPHDWHYLDIEKLLDQFEVSNDETDPDPARYRTRYHEDEPGLLFRYRLAQKLRSGTVEGICEQLRMLVGRLSK